MKHDWVLMMKKMYQAVLIASMVCGLSACGGSSSDTGSSVVTPPATQQAVRIHFAVKAGSQPVSCGTPITGVGTSSATAQLQDLRFYVSNVHLMTADNLEVPVTLVDDRQWQRNGIALIDLENGLGNCALNGTAAMNVDLVGQVPAGNYTGVGFTVGLPSELNHSNVATEAAPLDVNAMAWSWQNGRKLFKLELVPDAGVTTPAQPDATPPITQSTASAFLVHLGATGCSAKAETVGYACTNPNQMTFHSHAFDANTQQLVVDVASLLATTDITVNHGGPAGCMSGKTDPECVAIFEQLKIDLATGLPIDDGHGQGLFKVESK